MLIPIIKDSNLLTPKIYHKNVQYSPQIQYNNTRMSKFTEEQGNMKSDCILCSHVRIMIMQFRKYTQITEDRKK